VITRADIERAYGVISPWIRRTPVLAVAGRDLGVAVESVTLKLETQQRAGSFKIRGAFTNLLTRKIPPAGVVAASGGNHGAAVAYAAGVLGIPARIFVPKTAAPLKIERIRSAGAQVEVEGAGYADALARSEQWIASSGALAIHAFDQPETIQGQGTLALEVEEQVPDVDTVLLGVGGGGLLSGIAIWFGGSKRIIGVEPELSPTLTRALEAGGPVDAPTDSFATSLSPRRIGELVYPIVSRLTDKPILVTDAEIVAAQRAIWDAIRIWPEPEGAAAFAGLHAGRYQPGRGERVVVVVSGGNAVMESGG
jgi:threonine dehydratase